MSRSIPESSILKPLPPSLVDTTDDWPEFVLTNTHVHLPGDEYATTSLLEASAGYPLTVTGQLEPLDEEDVHFYLNAAPKRRIYVTLDNVKTFSYGQYADGTAAIWAAGKAGWFSLKPGKFYLSTYNTIVEAVNTLYFVADSYREPRHKGKGKNATVLPDYTAQQLFQKYAAEELGSSNTADGMEKIYEHKEFLITSMLMQKEGLFWSTLPIYTHFYTKFPDIFAKLKSRLNAVASESEDKAKNRRSRKGSVDSSSTTSTTKARGRPKKVHTGNAAVPNTMSASSRGASESSKMGPPTKMTSRRNRQDQAVDFTLEEPVGTPAKEGDSDEEAGFRARRNESSLRPRASKATKSSGRTGGKGPTAEDTEEDEQGLQHTPTAGKRKHTGDIDSRPSSKRRNSRPHDDEGIDIPTSPSDADSSSTPLGETSELILRGFNHAPDPVQEDTWMCALDGCIHKVYAASNPDSQRLIREHYALHAYDDDERVQLVKELQAPSLPASYLMERVKMQAKQEGFPGSVRQQMASRFPTTLPSTSLGVAQRY